MPVKGNCVHRRLLSELLCQVADREAYRSERDDSDQKVNSVRPGDQVEEKAARIGSEMQPAETQFLPGDYLTANKRKAQQQSEKYPTGAAPTRFGAQRGPRKFNCQATD